MPPTRRSPKPRRSLPPPRSPRRGTLRLGIVLVALVGVNLYVFLWRGGTSIPAVMERAAVAGDIGRTASAFGGLGGRDREVGAAEGASARASAEPEEDWEDPGTWLTGEVGSGDSLGAILRREGLEAPEADRLIRALSPHMDFRLIRPGQEYKLHVGADGHPTTFEFQVSATTKVVATREPGAGEGAATFAAEKLEAETQTVVHEVGGTIESSLFVTIRGLGEDPALVAFFVDVFAYDLNFFIDTHRGDTFRMLVEKEYLNGQFLRYGRVLAAEYSGKAGTHRAFHWQPPGSSRGRYYDEKGQSVEKTFLRTPLKYSRISSKFNPRRMHPILHRVKGHWGVDYAAPTGTPVWAAASGRVVFRGWRGGAGNCVIIQHDNGYTTVYMHLNAFRKGLQTGQRVRQKDVIGYVGMTGLATGPHLHFEVKQNGRAIDPLKMKMTRGPGVAREHRAAFEAHTSKHVRRLAGVPVTGQGLASGGGEDPGEDDIAGAEAHE
jgi:murein DD-endopeptidase MepM/ murein hydrolase activator NlpD